MFLNSAKAFGRDNSLERMVERPKEMEKIHFPIARPTIENLIRVLIYDFDVPSHVGPDEFEPVLISRSFR